MLNSKFISDYSVTIGNFLVGAVFGWLAPTLKTYRGSQNEFPLTDEDCSRMVMFQYLGRIFCCLLATATGERFGRVALITLTAILMAAAWTVTALTTIIPIHYAIRFICGGCFGMTNITTPIYIGENSPPQVRAIFNSICLMFLFGGQVVSSILATYCSYMVASAIIAGISVIGLASTFLLREPAQYLLVNGHEAKAEQQFFWLRGDDENAKREFCEMKAKLANTDTKFSFAYLADRRVLIVFAMNTLIFTTGFPAISSLVSIALSSADNFSENELTILFELMQFIGAIASLFIIDRYDRRPLWAITCILAIVFHLMTATLYHLHDNGVHIVGYSWLLFGSITAYTTVFSTLMFSLNCTARGELLPQKYKAAGSSTSLALNSVVGSIQGFTFLKIASAFGMKMNFIIFAAFSFVLLVFCYYLVPETRGMTLVEIEKLFEGSNKSESEEKKIQN